MLNGGLRLALVVVAPLVGAMVVHELRGRRLAGLVAVLVAIGASAALTASVAGGVSGAGSLEHTFGNAIPGVDVTTRGDSATVAAVLTACAAALLAVARRRDDREHLCGVLLCLAGGAAVAVAGNLVVAIAGVEVIAGGTLLVGGRSGAGSRSVRLLAGTIGAAGLALLAAAAQLIAGAGTSDLAAIPPTVVGGAVAVPWALAGAALILSAAAAARTRGSDWAAVGALPAGFLVLLRLQESAAGQLPGAASVTLAVAGAIAALVAAASALRATTVTATGRAAVGVLAGVLVSLFGGSLQPSGVLLAGLFLALEVALVAAPSWNQRPTVWSVLSIAVLALPGGTAITAVVVGLGSVAQRGTGGFPQLVVISAALAAAAVAAARTVVATSPSWRPLVPGAIAAVVAGFAGGLVPGLAMRLVATPLSGGAASVDLDAGALQVPGAGFAGGYIVLAAVILLVAATSAVLLAAAEPVAAPAASVVPRSMPNLALLLTMRRSTLPATRLLSMALDKLDHWLESQPRLPLFIGAAALAVLLFR